MASCDRGPACRPWAKTLRPAARLFAVVAVAAAPVALFADRPAFAHAFGARYELPAPVWLFIVGGALTVTLTFLLIAAFVRADAGRRAATGRDISHTPVGRFLCHPALRAAAKAAAALAVVMVVAAGVIGSPDPNRNIAPTLVWIVWWVGFSYVTMLIGNPWPVLNPWRTVFDGVAALRRRVNPNARPAAPKPYPQRLAAWPAVALLLLFGWLELIFPFSSRPVVVALLIVAYSAITWAGMRRFGPDAWLANVDPFHLVFDVFSRFAPLAAADGGADDRAAGNRKGAAAAPRLMARPYAVGLLRPGSDRASTPMMCFVLAMLSIVLFDGLLGSGHWTAVENAIHDVYPKLGDVGWVVVHTLGLLAMWLAFLGLFVGACRLMAAQTGGMKPAMEIARLFTPTLVPIAVAYHFAHTFTYLLVQGQGIIPLVSDPFGFGWDLFGTRGFQQNIAIMDTKTAWYLAVTVIVTGHVISVYLAHAVAGRLVESRRRALRCLIPMTALMVIYTIISLQILAEPLVRYSGPTKEIVEALPAVFG